MNKRTAEEAFDAEDGGEKGVAPDFLRCGHDFRLLSEAVDCNWSFKDYNIDRVFNCDDSKEHLMKIRAFFEIVASKSPKHAFDFLTYAPRHNAWSRFDDNAFNRGRLPSHTYPQWMFIKAISSGDEKMLKYMLRVDERDNAFHFRVGVSKNKTEPFINWVTRHRARSEVMGSMDGKLIRKLFVSSYKALIAAADSKDDEEAEEAEGAEDVKDAELIETTRNLIPFFKKYLQMSAEEFLCDMDMELSPEEVFLKAARGVLASPTEKK